MYVSYNLKYCYIQRRGAERRRTTLLLTSAARNEREDFKPARNDFVMASQLCLLCFCILITFSGIYFGTIDAGNHCIIVL